MKIEQKFPNKRALVTGAASGLGLAICERLATNGWKLLIADINASKLAEAEIKLQALGAQTLPLVMDVTQYESLENAAQILQENWGGVDLVFNNAGIATAGTIEELTDEDWKKTINIDLWSVIYGCRAFSPLLKKQGNGHIINTASSAGTLAPPEMAAYNVAKAGVSSDFFRKPTLHYSHTFIAIKSRYSQSKRDFIPRDLCSYLKRCATREA